MVVGSDDDDDDDDDNMTTPCIAPTPILDPNRTNLDDSNSNTTTAILPYSPTIFLKVSTGKGIRSTDQRLIKVSLPGLSNKTRASLGASPSSSAAQLASPGSTVSSPSSSAVKASPGSFASTPSPNKISMSFSRLSYPGKVTENDIAQFNLNVSICQLQVIMISF